MAEKRLKKTISLMVILVGILMIVFFTWYQNHFYHAPHKVNLSDYVEMSSSDYYYDIDNITELNRDYAQMKGWIVSKGKEIVQYDTKVILYTADESEAYLWTATADQRADVTQAINDGVNYDESGFKAIIPLKYTKGKEYKIALLFYSGQEQYLVKTGEDYVVEIPEEDEDE